MTLDLIAASKAAQLIAVSPEKAITGHPDDQATASACEYVAKLYQFNNNQKAALVSLIAHIGIENYLASDLRQLLKGRSTLQQLKTAWTQWHTNEPEYWQREAEFDLFICERA